jgi:hypothetical protein
MNFMIYARPAVPPENNKLPLGKAPTTLLISSMLDSPCCQQIAAYEDSIFILYCDLLELARSTPMLFRARLELDQYS